MCLKCNEGMVFEASDWSWEGSPSLTLKAGQSAPPHFYPPRTGAGVRKWRGVSYEERELR